MGVGVSVNVLMSMCGCGYQCELLVRSGFVDACVKEWVLGFQQDF